MFRASQVLKALERILWTNTNVYKNNTTMKAAAENAVKAHYDAQKLEEREVTEAAIRYLSSSNNGSLSYANSFIVARFIQLQESPSPTLLSTIRKQMELMLQRTMLRSST
jgi:hypothetical protein